MASPNEHELESVFEARSDEEAQMIIGILDTNGISAFANSNLPHSVYPVLGDAQVLVNSLDACKAREILKLIEDENFSEDSDE